MIEFRAGGDGSPLSQAVIVDRFVFTSGQVGRRSDGSLPIAFAEQLEQVLVNLDSLLRGLGSGLDRVVKVTAFMSTNESVRDFNDVYRRFFQPPYPARTRVEIAQLGPGYLVELEAIAILNQSTTVDA